MEVKQKLHLSIVPSYQCNYHCSYCYLGKLTNDKTLLDLNILKDRINELEKNYDIEHICLYGGEISLLDKKYINDMLYILGNKNIALVTNLSNDWIIDYALIHNIKLCVSLNKERPYYNETLDKLKKLKGIKNIKLSVVVLPSLINGDITSTFNEYKELGFNILFIQYHPSEYSKIKYDIGNNNFIEFVLKMCDENKKQGYPIDIDNEIIFNDDTYSPTMNNFVFISPNGKYSSVIYEKNIEKQIFFDTIEEWETHCKNEYKEYYSKCNMCQLFNKCKAEHLIDMGNKNDCSGFYNYFIK